GGRQEVALRRRPAPYALSVWSEPRQPGFVPSGWQPRTVRLRIPPLRNPGAYVKGSGTRCQHHGPVGLGRGRVAKKISQAGEILFAPRFSFFSNARLRSHEPGSGGLCGLGEVGALAFFPRVRPHLSPGLARNLT